MKMFKTALMSVQAAVMLTALSAPGITSANEEVVKRSQDPNQWGAIGRDYGLNRYSPLKDINTETVKDLQMIWALSSSTLRGHEGQPLFISDVGGKPMLFAVTAWPNIVWALDMSNPDNYDIAWRYEKKTDRDESAIPRACCDVVNRGLSYADGKVVFGTLDGYVIALDAKSGNEIWVTKHAYPENGETQTPAPIIVNDKVIAGFGGDEFAARGRLSAYNLKDGSVAWKWHSNGPDKDVGYAPDFNSANPHFGQAGSDIGVTTYPKDEWKIGGGAPWAWYSFDPKLNLVYASTGNPGHWSPSYRCGEDTHEKCNTGKWDNKWSMTTFARDADTGLAKWAYQMTPFDQWDYDGVNENLLVEMDIDGEKNRPVLVHFDRNGFVYVHDRRDGTLLRAHKFVTVDWAEKVDLETGRPVKVKKHSPFAIGVATPACPSAMGGKDQQPCAVDPTDPEHFYCPTNNWCMTDEPTERTHTTQGTVYVFANVHMKAEVPGILGKFKKFNVNTGKTVWEIPDNYPNWGGALVTAGGLAFYGSFDGDFRGIDRNSGKVVWERRLGSGVIGNPISYKTSGKQYISVWSGMGGWVGLPPLLDLDKSDPYGAIGATALSADNDMYKLPAGGTLYTFRLAD